MGERDLSWRGELVEPRRDTWPFDKLTAIKTWGNYRGDPKHFILVSLSNQAAEAPYASVFAHSINLPTKSTHCST